MQRRKFIVALGGAATWPLAVRAQQPARDLNTYPRTRQAPGSGIGRLARCELVHVAFGRRLIGSIRQG
jgi:hypothetical protein